MTGLFPVLVGVALAQGFDAGGPDSPPDSARVADPLWGWGGGPSTAPQLSARAGWVDGALQRTVVDAGDETVELVVDDLVPLQLDAAVGLSERVALGATLPLFVASRGVAGGGPALGDARVFVPVHLTDAIALVPQLRLPTGAEARFLGAPGPGVAFDLSAGTAAGPLALNGDVGVSFGPSTGEPAWPGGGVLRGAASVGWIANDAVALHAEFRGRAPMSDAGGAPSEIGLTAKMRPDEVWWVSAGVATALTQGVGAARARAQLTLGRSFGAADEPGLVPRVTAGSLVVVDEDGLPIRDAEVTIGRWSGRTDHEGRVDLPNRVDAQDAVAVTHPAFEDRSFDRIPEDSVVLSRPPVPLQVRVIGPDGRPAEADVRISGPTDPGEPTVGEDGSRTWYLQPGAWKVEVDGDGLGGQERTVDIEQVRTEEVEVDVVLAPRIDDTRLKVRVVDARGTPVEDAQLRIDETDLGTTATGGDVVVRGLPEGAGELVVRSNRGHMATAVPVRVGQETDVEVVLDWAPGSVLVRARGPDGAVTDGLVALMGPEWTPARRLGADGTAQLTLPPGTWRAMVSSPTLGSQERAFEVTDRPGELVELDMVLQPLEDGVADLTVRVVDPDGVPLSNVDVLVDGRPVGTTSPRGELTLLGLQDGFRTLRIEGELLKPVEGQFEIRPGAQLADVTARWVPGVVEVVVRGPDGGPEDALVAFEGPSSRSPVTLGPDGRELVVLDEGPWTMLVSSAAWGSQVRELDVVHGGGRRKRVAVDLLPVDDGGGQLALSVTDPRDRPVDGARVQLRGVPVGATSDGRVELQGLALGPAEVTVEADALQAETTSVDIGGETSLEVPLSWAPGALEVTVTGPEDPGEVLLFVTGDAPRPPVRPGPDGTRLLGLEPGTWWVLASAEDFRSEEQRVQLSGRAELSELDIALERASADAAALLVRVIDEQGQPVRGVEILRGGAPLGTTSPSGALSLEDLDPGPIALELGETKLTAGIGFEAELEVGSQTRQVVVPYKPRTVRVSVVDTEGRPAAGARVRASGRDDLPLGTVGDDGTMEIGLVPGAWRFTAQVDGGGGAASLVLSPGVKPVDVTVEVAAISSAFTEGGLTLSDPIRFDLDQATLRPEASPILDDIARLLQSEPDIVLVEIQGHTDDQGGPAYNQKLSQRRADAVRQALMERGVAAERMLARGYGLTRPVTLDRAPSARARNRRVEVVIREER